MAFLSLSIFLIGCRASVDVVQLDSVTTVAETHEEIAQSTDLEESNEEVVVEDQANADQDNADQNHANKDETSNTSETNSWKIAVENGSNTITSYS